MGLLLLQGSAALNPRELFANNEQGLWLDPSDFSTMWQDSGKTTPVTAAGDPVGYISDKSGRGNDASQSTSASRPTLARIPSSGRRNLLTYSEDLSNAAWVNNGGTVTSNSTIAPDGTTTADTLTRSTAATEGRYQAVAFTGDGAKAVSVYVKAGTAPSLGVWLFDSTATVNRMLAAVDMTGATPIVTLTAGASSVVENVGSGWFRLTFVSTSVTAANTNRLYLMPAYGGASANGQTSIFWGAMAENAATATSYQKVVATTDVTESGVSDLWHLVFDGADDFLTAGDVCDIGSNSSMIVVGGSISGANGSLVAKSRAATGAGRFGLFRDTSSTTALYSDSSSGRTASFSDTNSLQRIYSSYVDRTNGTLILRVNATQQAAATPWTPESTSHDTTNRLLIGAYNNSTDTGEILRLNGAIFQVIVRQSATPTGKLLEAERFVARKTGVTGI